MNELNGDEMDRHTEKDQKKTTAIEEQKSKDSPTPFDDTWRTIATEICRLLIPIVNVAFSEHFSEDSEVTSLANEQITILPDGTTQKEITDGSFSITEEVGTYLSFPQFAFGD